MEGMCPSTVGQVGICVELCSEDNDCDGIQKCCFNGCGHTCVDPAPIGNTISYLKSLFHI